jgi:hypothetical protein
MALIRFLFDSESNSVILGLVEIDGLGELWTLGDLVAEAATRLEALPAPKNGQVRAVPDERTIRYYSQLDLLDRPAAMRGRTAYYNRRHLAQIVAIKRMQSAGHSLADIQAMWPTIDETTLSRISGVLLESVFQPSGKPMRTGRKNFWRNDAESGRDVGAPSLPPQYPVPPTSMPMPRPAPKPVPVPPPKPVELRVDIAPGVAIVVALPTERSISISPADVHAVRVAAVAVVTELANRGLIARGTGTLEEKP